LKVIRRIDTMVSMTGLLPEEELCALSGLRCPQRAVIVEFRVDPSEVVWLRAVGLARGDEVEVLRQGPLGGPVHVRTPEGGEFALDRRLASRIDVRSCPSPSEP
jgi:Fe2+ transport system protein FeoA